MDGIQMPSMGVPKSGERDTPASEPALRQLRSVKWRVTTGKVHFSPVPIGQFIAVAGILHSAVRNYGFLHAFDADTGTSCWAFDGDSRAGIPGGITTTPATAEGMVMFGSGDGRFYGIQAKTGRPIWEFCSGKAIHSSPTVYADTVVFGSDDCRAYALEVSSGRLKWQYSATARIHASPVADENAVYLADADGTIHALDRSGTLIWRLPITDLRPVSISESQGILLIGDLTTEGVIAITLSDRRPLWTFSAGSGAAAPAISLGIVCNVPISGHGTRVSPYNRESRSKGKCSTS
jgi:outer membrane protein assembly factor BamB